MNGVDNVNLYVNVRIFKISRKNTVALMLILSFKQNGFYMPVKRNLRSSQGHMLNSGHQSRE